MKCKHCGGDVEIRNPKGYCDHLYYPEACPVCTFIQTASNILEEQFPKGECKERGSALVLFARIVILVKELVKCQTTNKCGKKHLKL